MKINRPEGISQANRSNPYFIILRRVSDIQIQLAEKCAKNLCREFGYQLYSLRINGSRFSHHSCLNHIYYSDYDDNYRQCHRKLSSLQVLGRY